MRTSSPTEMEHQHRESSEPSPLNRLVQNPISIHEIEKPGSAQLASFSSAANSPMFGSRSYPLTPLKPPSPPLRTMKGFVLQPKPTNNVCICMYIWKILFSLTRISIIFVLCICIYLLIKCCFMRLIGTDFLFSIVHCNSMYAFIFVSQQSLEPYRKHKAATHKLQLNKGFKYTKKMNLSTDSLY